MPTVQEQLTALAADFSEVKGMLKEHAAHVTLTVAKHDRAIFGTDKSRGLLTRANSLEVADRRRTWQIRAIVTAAMGGAASWAASHLSFFKG